ncbi:DUF4222 domain-containing protein [Salmonella enterica]|uniref:DUF4222 domain-containing protein n=1 Tax=Salmonella oranienberg TaxID=28147 RepID=A0A730AQN7_SALON|nr:DUF4222 domain-containing protein [Salmonella enterica]EEJ1461354.1 DUF4222 domain-containing protein [Salmonella enterica subsp. enterica serovar Virginia]HAE3616562.1 DUF4222 domain-containing protein [Salmonella enterica subsp. enterica serovar Oranienburg]EAP4322073.1 DUF4222 domain-containing protein [Salmonella enterica]EAT5604083.1 DUF4222 domain-containing protein [Salmonella enterica]
MNKKNSGLTASGLSRPEIRPGDIYRDKSGRRVMIKTVSATRIVFVRPGYPDECFCSPSRLVRDFIPIKKQTFQEWAQANSPLEKTKKLRALINASNASRERRQREAKK